MNKRGIVLIISYVVIAVLTVLAVGFVMRSAHEYNTVKRYADYVRGFWLAEAGLSRALNELRANYNWPGTEGVPVNLSNGRYEVAVDAVGQLRKVTCSGFVPVTGTPRVERIIEAMISGSIAPDFFDYALYSAGDIDINGDAYTITGDVLYADDLDVEHPENITGTLTPDPSASPLGRFNFAELRAISLTQNNIYSAARLSDVQNGTDSFPASFWFTPPTVPGDPTTGVPNVVYVETDLQLNGNIGTIGGFFVVVGDVLTDPDATEDLTINGNGEIDGIVYTRGTFRVNGGGGGLNVNGGVWSGEEARINGNATIAYNADFMSAIDALNITPEVQIIFWRDKQLPFRVAP